MKQFFKIMSIIFLGLCLISCKKDKVDFPTTSFKTIISLTSDYRIIEVSNFSGLTLNYNIKFSYSSTNVIMTETDSVNKVSRKKVYFLNSNGLADTCIDSIFVESSQTFVNFIIFKYDNKGYMIQAKTIATSFYNDSSSLTYEILNGNIDDILLNTFNSQHSIYMPEMYVTEYDYYSLINKINIFSFMGEFNGKKNINLTKSYYSMEQKAPSTQPPVSKYSYVLDKNGLVIEMDEIRKLSYNVASQSSSYEKRITKYEYKFQ